MKKEIYNVMAIGAHPDDIELGCGGTLVKHVLLGHNVYVLIITNGEKGDHSPTKDECLNSFEKLGINKSNIFFGDFPDGYLLPNHELVDFIEKKIIEFNIERVYTHYPYDRHQDHRYLSAATSSATRRTPTLLLFQGPSTAFNFEPHYFVTLSEEILNSKLNALCCYNSQIKKNSMNIDLMKSIAIINGHRTNTKYAEAFALNHMITGEEYV